MRKHWNWCVNQCRNWKIPIIIIIKSALTHSIFVLWFTMGKVKRLWNMLHIISMLTKRDFWTPVASFFSVIHYALISTEKYGKILSLCKRYKLLTKENIASSVLIICPLYNPIIIWLNIWKALFQRKAISSIIKTYTNLMDDNYRSQKINELLSELMPNIPGKLKFIKESLILNQ